MWTATNGSPSDTAYYIRKPRSFPPTNTKKVGEKVKN